MDLIGILTLIRTHAWIALAWLAVTAIVNTVFRWKSPAELDVFAERSPVLAKIAALFRHLGIDPVSALKVIASFFARNPPPPGRDDPPPPAVAIVPTEAPTRRDLLAPPVQAAAFAVATGAIAAGCALFTPKNVRTVLNDADKFCIVEHEILDVPATEVACNIEHAFAPAIETVLSAHREQVARDRAAIAARRTDAGDVH
jgi:hypothetical protein